VAGLLQLHVDTAQWDEAFRLLRAHPDYDHVVYLPYAAWLAERGRFDEALDAFARAGRSDQALAVLQQLAHNAVREDRFADASYYFWRLALQHVAAPRSEESPAARAAALAQYAACRARAELYYAFNPLHRSSTDPFTALMPEALFNMARYLLVRVTAEGDVPLGVSRVYAAVVRRAGRRR
jgi:intraflagellar transport protein 122